MLVHHHELTYSLAIPEPVIAHRGRGWWVCQIHRRIIEALAVFGVHATAVPAGGESGRGEALCFRHQTPGDLVIDGHKIVGSAQHKVRGGLLQHGGILLARSIHAPTLPGILELAGVNLTAQHLAESLTGLIQELRPTPTPWSPEQDQRAACWVREKFGDNAWNAKR
jgi:lipoate-protein ligase A